MQVSEYKTPKNDYIFKKIFGSKGNEEILRDFLESILEEKIEKVELDLQTEMQAETIKEKGVRLDVRARLDDKTEVNVEIQISKEGFSEERCLAYWSRVYQTTLEKSKEYETARRTISIWILGENVYNDTKEYHTKWQMQEVNTGMKGHFKHEEIHIIELKKLHFCDNIKPKKKEFWLCFIDHTKEEAVKMACYTEKQIQEAEEQYKKITADEKMMAIIEMRERAKREMEEDKYAARKAGIEEGIEKGKKAGIEEGKKVGIEEGKKAGIEEGKKAGIEEGKKVGIEEGKKAGIEEGKKAGIEEGKKAGIKESKKEIARKLKETGMEIKQIAEITGLSEEEIDKL